MVQLIEKEATLAFVPEKSNGNTKELIQYSMTYLET